MSKWIDAECFKRKIDESVFDADDKEWFLNLLLHVPSIDLVRCKDCKWREHIGCALRIVDDSDKPKDDDYCSFGERKDE